MDASLFLLWTEHLVHWNRLTIALYKLGMLLAPATFICTAFTVLITAAPLRAANQLLRSYSLTVMQLILIWWQCTLIGTDIL